VTAKQATEVDRVGVAHVGRSLSPVIVGHTDEHRNAAFGEGRKSVYTLAMRTADAADRVHETLRQQLAAGLYAPGQTLREARLARELGVSRTPVREAVRRLVASGVLQQEPNHAPQVRRPAVHELGQLYELRAELEGYAAREAARHAVPEQVQQLREAAAGFAELADQAATERWRPGPKAFEPLIRVELAFHHALHAAANHPWLQQMLERVDLVHQVFRRLGGFDPDADVPVALQRSAERHRHLVELIAAGQADEARRYLADCLLETRDRMLARRQPPDASDLQPPLDKEP